jgi:hypothetical protein
MAGDFKAATTSAGQALDLYRQLGCRLGQANALHILGIVQNLIGDHRAATTSAGQALDLYQQVGCRPGQANALNTLGVVQYQIGGYPPATPCGHAHGRSPAGVEDTARRLRPYGPVP